MNGVIFVTETDNPAELYRHNAMALDYAPCWHLAAFIVGGHRIVRVVCNE